MAQTKWRSNHRYQPSVDKGWAWVILAAVFTERLLASTVYLSGIYNVVFLEEFGMSKSLTAWCGAVHISMMSLTGPIASLLVSVIGVRRTMLVGTTLSVGGYLSSAFAPNLYVMFITYGILAGSGFSFTYVSSFVILGVSFKKYRNIAYGIVTMAIGMGGMILAPLLQYLITEFGYRGSMVINAGIICHMYVVAAVLRPTVPDKEIQFEKATTSELICEENPKCSDCITNDNATNHTNTVIVSDILCNGTGKLHPPLPKSETSRDELIKKPVSSSKPLSPISLTRVRNSESKQHFASSQPDISSAHNSEPTQIGPVYSYSSENINQKCTNPMYKVDSMNHLKEIFQKDVFTRMSSDFIAQSYNSIQNLNNNHHQRTLTKSAQDINSKANLELEYENKSKRRTLVNRYKPIIQAKFIIYCITLLLFNFGAAVTYIHFPAFAIANGSTLFQAAQVVSVLGIVNIVSRLLTGMATSNNGLDISIVFMASGGLAGLVLCIGPPLLGTTFSGQILIAIGYAMYCNCHMALMGPITIELIGLESFTEAYGVELFMEAIGIMIGPPIGGIAFDVTGSYNYSMLIGGLSLITGSVVMMLIPVCSTKAV